MKDSNLGNSEFGLTLAQVNERKAAGLINIQPPPIAKTTTQIFKDNICTLFNLFNVLITIALLSVGAWQNCLFIVIITINTTIGIAQELHAKKLVEQLSLISAPTAEVIRDGQKTTIPIGEVVQDDIVILDSGKQICADCIVETGEIEANESMLTGESDPIFKKYGEHLYSGSYVVSGRCRARVEHVGSQSYTAKITAEVKKLRKVNSEMISAMRKVTKLTGFLILPLGALLFAQALFFRNNTLPESVVTTAAALLGMLPKGLLLLISISLATGIQKLSKQKVLVQELYALETLAHVDTLCLDKTGTLTEGKMKVESVNELAKNTSLPFAELMGSFLANSDDNNATFLALQAYFPTNSKYKAVKKIAFSSERKWSAVTFADIGTFVIGAPEKMNVSSLPENVRLAIDSGKRVLGAGIVEGSIEHNQLPRVRLLATITLVDPLRKQAAETLDFFAKEGVDIKIISGDNPKTVAVLAAQAGLSGASNCIDMSRLTKESEVKQAALNYSVFGRVSPQQKKQIVQSLQENGRSVAMTGDGVNDLLALREADCSIAVAEGSDAVKQVAQVVLIDSNFASLPSVLCEGRRVVNNVTRAAGVFFVKTIYSALVALICLILNIPFPFIPIQITLIDLAIEGYPSFFLSFEPDNKKVTGRFLPEVLRRAIPNALAFVFCYLGVLILRSRLPISAEQVSFLLYALVGLTGIQAVYKICRPFNPLRIFLVSTMSVGFYTAVALFHKIIKLPLPSVNTLACFVGFAVAFLILERILFTPVRNAKIKR